MSELQALQSYLTNDLRVFRAPFFAHMQRITVGGLPEAGPSEQGLWQVSSLDVFESWYVCGIVGGRRPSTYSESPQLWNTYFAKLGQRGVFFGFDLPREEDFQAFLLAFQAVPGCLDLTVTDPYKHAAYHSVKGLAYSVEWSDQARNTETVNHIIFDVKSDRVLVLNTDGLGMIRVVKEQMDISGKKVLLIGAGGSAASIGYEFVMAGNELFIMNRTLTRAEGLGGLLGQFAKPTQALHWGGFDRTPAWLPQADIVINTVAKGCPVDSRHAGLLREGVLLAETKYGDKSELRTLARETGKCYVDGKAMLFGQFVEAVAHVFPILGVSRETHDHVVTSWSTLSLDPPPRV